MRIRTWNNHTMYETGKADQVANEMKKYGIEVLGICESRTIKSVYWKASNLLPSDHPEDNYEHTEVLIGYLNVINISRSSYEVGTDIIQHHDSKSQLTSIDGRSQLSNATHSAIKNAEQEKKVCTNDSGKEALSNRRRRGFQSSNLHRLERDVNHHQAFMEERRSKRVRRLIRKLSLTANGYHCEWNQYEYMVSDHCTCGCEQSAMNSN
ncbi:unnamed protein product [Trichobilharzia regenti]|nr:unnamed protein product [Trichobilharzia regenti]